MIEYDRTRRPKKQESRFTRYDRFLAEGWRDSRYAQLTDEPGVVFICSSPTVLPAMLRVADKHLTAWTGPAKAAPRDGHYPGREQFAFTTFDRVADGDWEMQQVPALPPNLRDMPWRPRAITLPLDRLFTSPFDPAP